MVPAGKGLAAARLGRAAPGLPRSAADRVASPPSGKVKFEFGAILVTSFEAT